MPFGKTLQKYSLRIIAPSILLYLQPQNLGKGGHFQGIMRKQRNIWKDCYLGRLLHM